MKNSENLVFWGIIALTLLLIFFSVTNMDKCNDTPHERDTVRTVDTVIVTDTFYSLETLTVNKPKIIYVDIPYSVDTAEILKRYFAHCFYHDTLKNDTNLLLVMDEEIAENSVVNRVLQVNDYEQTKIIHEKEVVTVYDTKTRYYVGGSFGVSDRNPFMGLNFSLLTKKRHMAGLFIGYPLTIAVNYNIPINKK